MSAVRPPRNWWLRSCEKAYVRFTAAEGAGDHCEVGARALYHERSVGWLDAQLEPARVAA